MKRILSLFVVAFVLCGVGPVAEAHQKYTYKTKGNHASFSSSSYDDCSYSGVYVSAFEEQQKSNGQTSYGAVYVDYYSYDFCTGHSEYGYAYIDSSNFSQQKLNSASLDASGEMQTVRCDYDTGGGGADAGVPPYYDPCIYSTAPVTISADWTGTGDTYKERSSSAYSSPYARYRSRYTGSYRDATVTGVLDIGGTQIALSDGWASLAQTSSGSFEMYR